MLIKKIREIRMSMVNTTYNSTEHMNNTKQQLKGKMKFNFYKNISNYYTQMKNKIFQTQQDPFSRNAQGIKKIYHEVILLMTFLQTKPQIETLNNNYHDLYYSVIKNRDRFKDIDNQFENDENDYISLNDVIIPNHYLGIRGREI